jgi:Icc protein
MRGVERVFLPIVLGRVSGLPPELEGLIVTSDLQGKVKHPQNRTFQLLGEVLPEILRLVIEVELRANPLRFGAVLAGDMFALLEKRGGLGDVIPVWDAFRGEFRWVAGVAGNHDRFGDTPEEHNAFLRRSHMHLLHGELCEPDGLRVGGVSGIIGRKGKPNRYPADDYLNLLTNVQQKRPDIIVLHQSPDFSEHGEHGHEEIREFLELGPPSLVVAGHTHWKEALREMENGGQVLNCDARAFVLLPE